MNTLATVCRVDNYVRSFQLSDGSIINCMIYDTAGQERFDALNITYYKKANAVLLVYDISEKSSFEKIKSFYVPKIKENCTKNIPILLLGNKTDMENERQVTFEEGFALASEEDYEFKEASCLDNINVAGAFENLMERWNFESHGGLNVNIINEYKNNSKNDLNMSFTKSLTQLKLGNEMEKIRRNRSFTTLDKLDKGKETFSLTKTDSKNKKKKKCCK